MRSWLALIAIASLAAAACGGKVVFDISDGGAGGAQTGPTTSHVSASNVSSTSKSASSGPEPNCPDPLPVEGACPIEGQTCPIHLSCCEDNAICESGFWTYPGQSCKKLCENVCGPNGFACGDGVCVALIGQSTTYECRTSPCVGALDCSCAEAICEQSSLTCNNIQDGYKILCD